MDFLTHGNRRITFFTQVITTAFTWHALAGSGYAQFNPSENQPWPVDGLTNPYQLEAADFDAAIRQGRIHALQYPVELTGLKFPYRPLKNALDHQTQMPYKKFALALSKHFTGVGSYSDLMAWVGLYDYPEDEGEGAYYIPFPNGKRPDFKMGETFYQDGGDIAASVSCAGCHSGNLFGRKILGMTNRRARANEFIRRGAYLAKPVPSWVFKNASRATDGEEAIYRDLRENIYFIESRKPSALGLDTSLAHVALSLSHREEDGLATKSTRYRNHPRSEALRSFVADSKPLPWWNVKFKNKWLSDGSVVSGNPIFTNILWNEIGRGTDLADLEEWLRRNGKVIEEITTAVFSAQAPRWTDFFDPKTINLERAIRGQSHFRNYCGRCHGDYVKEWEDRELNEHEFLSPTAELLGTKKVKYFANTFTVDVGTDPNRWQGMKSLLQLNDLNISKEYNIVIKVQKGYVPPPLVGIWARWPYFHNNSVASLCQVLTVSSQRVNGFWMGPANDAQRDFDSSCVGYPLGAETPKTWMRSRENYYDTKLPGLSNAGHDRRIFLDQDGNEIFSEQDKLDIIEFLKTL